MTLIKSLKMKPVGDNHNVSYGSKQFTKAHDYSIGEAIGKGAFSSIRIAYHLRTKKTYAVKIISKNRLSQCPMSKKILFNETILAPLMDHPCIIDIKEMADIDSHIFQFMRFAEYGDLLRKLRKSPFELSITVRLIDQLFSAVEYIHGLGICHRDIKLENLLLSKHGGLKLCDFGFASMTLNGIVHGNCGSYEYSAPEAIQCQEFDGFKADMWSCGVVIYALLARRLPFSNVSKNFDFNNTRVNYAPIPAEFQKLIQMLLSPDPQKRPSATECRAFSCLQSTQIKKRFPLSSLSVDSKICEEMMLISKLSQVLGVPYDAFYKKMVSSEMNREKILLKLFKRKNEQITPRMEGQVAKNEETQKGFFGIPTIVNVEVVEKRAMFKVPASVVFSTLHSIAIKQKFSVSSPLSSSPTMISLEPVDHIQSRLSFTILDGPEPGMTSVLFFADKEASGILNAFLKYLSRHLS